MSILRSIGKATNIAGHAKNAILYGIINIIILTLLHTLVPVLLILGGVVLTLYNPTAGIIMIFAGALWLPLFALYYAKQFRKTLRALKMLIRRK